MSHDSMEKSGSLYLGFILSWLMIYHSTYATTNITVVPWHWAAPSRFVSAVSFLTSHFIVHENLINQANSTNNSLLFLQIRKDIFHIKNIFK